MRDGRLSREYENFCWYFIMRLYDAAMKKYRRPIAFTKWKLSFNECYGAPRVAPECELTTSTYQCRWCPTVVSSHRTFPGLESGRESFSPSHESWLLLCWLCKWFNDGTINSFGCGGGCMIMKKIMKKFSSFYFHFTAFNVLIESYSERAWGHIDRMLRSVVSRLNKTKKKHKRIMLMIHWMVLTKMHCINKQNKLKPITYNGPGPFFRRFFCDGDGSRLEFL
jgi:hypothetical protein